MFNPMIFINHPHTHVIKDETYYLKIHWYYIRVRILCYNMIKYSFTV